MRKTPRIPKLSANALTVLCQHYLAKDERDRVIEAPTDMFPRVARDSALAEPTARRHSDSGVSKTMNLPPTATTKDVATAFTLAHELGCKG
jgi:ribonucleotide reductase alpha subunit